MFSSGAERKSKSNAQSSSTPAQPNIGTLEDWLAKRAKKKEEEETTSEPSRKRTRFYEKYKLPTELADIPNLPPSILPPTKDDYLVKYPWLDWG